MSKTKEVIGLYTSHDHGKQVQGLFGEWVTAPFAQEEKECIIAQLWELMPSDADAATELAYRKFEQRIATEKTYPHKHKVRRVVNRIVRSAAILLIPMMIVSITYLILNEREHGHNIDIAECFVPNGQMRTVVLPDSSIVKLNSGSVLIYPRNFSGSRREIFLNGEANFEVARDAAHPFIVKTCDMTVEVLGTVFSISTYSDDDFSAITLKSGSVKIEMIESHQEFTLDPGQQVIFDRGDKIAKKRESDSNRAFVWEEGKLIFQSNSIHQIIKIIERRYDVSIYLTSSKWDNSNVTAKFINGESLDEFMLVFTNLLPGMKYRIDNNNIYIY